MKRTQIALLTGLTVLFFCCKKNEYTNTSTSTQPVFSFNGTINNAPITIQAGIDNYQLNTSYAADSNGIYNFSGEFSTQSSGNSLLIYFKDIIKGAVANGQVHIDSLINPGYYSYAKPSGGATQYSVAMTDFFNQTPLSWSWVFGDGTTGNTHNPSHTYKHPGIYSASVTISSGSCASSDTNPVLVGQVGNAFKVEYSYSAVGNTLSFSAITGGVAPYTYLWNFGDASASGSAAPVHTYASAGVYPSSCSVTDATGYTGIYRMYACTQAATPCAAGFYEGTITPVANPLNLNDIGIEWTDATGKLWKSERDDQGLRSMFQVTSVSDFQNNSQGQPVKKITARITCELYHTPDSISFSGTVTFGVAHY